MPFASALLLLAACSPPEDGAPVDSEVETAGATDTAAMQPGDRSLADPAANSVTSPAGGVRTIPQAVQGRWGLNAADCEPGRSDAKGLLTIGPESVRFYESAGELERMIERDADRLRANFAMTGEGMQWQREFTFALQDGGRVLVRSDRGEGAASEPLRYTRCLSGAQTDTTDDLP